MYQRISTDRSSRTQAEQNEALEHQLQRYNQSEEAHLDPISLKNDVAVDRTNHAQDYTENFGWDR